jgi:hypothetical protein
LIYKKLKKQLLRSNTAAIIMEAIAVLKKLIIQKLIRADIWGGKHTPLDFVVKGIPEHFRNTPRGKKAVEKALKELANDGWIIILAKKTRKGSDEHVSLNPRKVSEIKQFLESS